MMELEWLKFFIWHDALAGPFLFLTAVGLAVFILAMRWRGIRLRACRGLFASLAFLSLTLGIVSFAWGWTYYLTLYGYQCSTIPNKELARQAELLFPLIVFGALSGLFLVGEALIQGLTILTRRHSEVTTLAS